jgi:hypothetical protein
MRPYLTRELDVGRIVDHERLRRVENGEQQSSEQGRAGRSQAADPETTMGPRAPACARRLT